MKVTINTTNYSFDSLQDVVFECRNLNLLPSVNPDGSPVRGNPQMILHPLIKSGIVTIEEEQLRSINNSLFPDIGSPEKMLIEAIKNITGNTPAQINEGQVRAIIQSEITKIQPQIKKLEIKINNQPEIKIDSQHKNFPDLLNACIARVNPYLVGETGSGKTTAAMKVSEILNLPFYAESFSRQASLYQLMGYTDANGNYIESKLYKAFKQK